MDPQMSSAPIHEDIWAGGLVPIETPIEQVGELVWQNWIVSLPVWERTFVYLHELDWHDDLASGDLNWAEIEVMLNVRFPERIAEHAAVYSG